MKYPLLNHATTVLFAITIWEFIGCILSTLFGVYPIKITWDHLLISFITFLIVLFINYFVNKKD